MLKGIRWNSWRFLCLPKSVKGLGFHDLALPREVY